MASSATMPIEIGNVSAAPATPAPGADQIDAVEQATALVIDSALPAGQLAVFASLISSR